MNEKRRGYDVPEPPHRNKRFCPRSRRGDDSDYYGRFDEKDESAPRAGEDLNASDGWECTECHAWNKQCLSESSTCQGCGVLPKSRDSVDQDDDGLDEFGRRRPPPSRPAPRWPPDFDTNGSKYVLDNRSGMFYEAESKFFYDPTTKLYYSHEKQAYFRHRLADNGKSVFDAVEHEPTRASGPTSTADTDKQMMMPAISINLKTKRLASSTKKTKKKKDGNADTQRSELKVANRDLSRIPKTPKGEPICALCKRKFPTLDKLFYHEKASQLHKSNLAKQAMEKPADAPQQAPEEQVYVDRAEQRRLLQGSETTAVSVTAQSPPEVSGAATALVDPKDTLNETNIGNKLLQKLGWQQGTSLGRRPNEGGSERKLEQDWERIERLAASGGGGRK